jgi:hypothetical protein
MSVSANFEVLGLTRNELAAAIDAAPHGAEFHVDVIQLDDRKAGRRFDIRVTSLTMTGARDLMNSIHDHMDAAANPKAVEA